jgi:uncharacterized membrane protein YhiD involved in acid resistance
MTREFVVAAIMAIVLAAVAYFAARRLADRVGEKSRTIELRDSTGTRAKFKVGENENLEEVVNAQLQTLEPRRGSKGPHTVL